MKVDRRVRKAALCLQDQELLAKLSVGDLIAIEAKYHNHCILALYNKAERQISDNDSDTYTHKEQTCKGIALAELISYIGETREENEESVFRLADLVKLYENRLEQLGLQYVNVNSTHLKTRLLMHMPDFNAYNKGRDVFLAHLRMLVKCYKEVMHVMEMNWEL